MPNRPCWVEINTHSFEDNYRFLCGLSPDAELLAMVKADAYGHSLALCAPAAARAGARWLGVTSVEEGIACRAATALEPETRILVISGVFPGEGSAALEHRLTPVVWEAWQLAELESAALAAGGAPVAVHLEIDTGMSRQGVDLASLDGVLARLQSSSTLRLEGVMTHLFAADEADGRATLEQFSLLDQSLSRITSAGFRPEWLNVGNSAALLSGDSAVIVDMAKRHGMSAMVRPGLAIYGLVPEYDPQFGPEEPQTILDARVKLRTVLEWKTRVVGVRSISAGAVVGYNGTFVATESMQLALLSVGYADGLVRGLGNQFSVLVRGQRAPLVGRISMDQAVVDVTEIAGVEPGDEVVLLGNQGGESISAFDHAHATQTIPWEVFTRIGARVPRIAV